MPIIISKKGVVPADMVQKSSFEKEDNLQEYIRQYPEAIPIYEIHQDKRLLVIAREFETPSGPVDALAIDNDGDVYVVETKLYTNSDKRRVVAQLLDYGASLWKHCSDFASFMLQIDIHAQKQWGRSLQEKIKEFFRLESDELGALMANIRDRLADGELKFVVLMDAMDDRLKQLITYINQKSKFDIYGVEVELYQYEDYEIVIPKVYGISVKKDVPPTSKVQITEQELRDQIRARNPEHENLAATLFSHLNSLGLTAKATRTTINYGVTVVGDFISILSFNAFNIWFSLPIRAVRALGDERWVKCKQIVNGLGRFYRQEDLELPTTPPPLGPRYDILAEHSPQEFLSALTEIGDLVKAALAHEG